jgi:hypothetical protein
MVLQQLSHRQLPTQNSFAAKHSQYLPRGAHVSSSVWILPLSGRAADMPSDRVTYRENSQFETLALATGAARIDPRHTRLAPLPLRVGYTGGTAGLLSRARLRALASS